MRKLIAIGCIFLAAAIAKGQLPQYHARIFDARNGLGATNITDLFKDRQDFLWITYTNAIERFDGRTAERFSFNEPVAHYLNDENNNTWVIGPSSIHRYSELTGKFHPVKFDSAGGKRPIRIFQLPSRPVTLMTLKGFFEWNEPDQQFHKVNKPFVTPGFRMVPTFFDTCAYTLFYPGGRYLYAHDYVKEKIDSLPASNIFSVYAFTPSLAIFTRYDGLAFWADFTKRTVTPLDAGKYFPEKSIVHFRISGVTQTTAGRFLVLTNAGLMEYDLTDDRFMPLGIYEDGKPFEYENALSRLMLDKNGIAWAHAETIVASLSPIDKVLGLLRNKEPDPKKKWNNVVFAFAEDENNRLWMATGFGFTRLDPRSGNMEVFHPVEDATDRLSHESVRGILFDGTHVILAPTDKGIWLYNPISKKYRRPLYASDTVKKLSEHDFYDMIYTLRNGDHIFPGRDALYIMEDKSYTMRILPLPDRDANCNFAFQDSKRRIWVGAMTAIYCFDETYRLLFKTGAGIHNAACMYETSSDKFFIGTGRGLYKMMLEDDRAAVIPVSTIMDNTPVAVIYRDSLAHYWFSSTSGLFMSDTGLTTFRKFDYADNIQSLLYSGNSFIRKRDGLAFFGGRHGVNYFIPEKFDLQDYPLNVHVKSVFTTTGDTIPAAGFQNTSYAYNKGRFAFNITTPYYFNTSKIEFRYRLTGLYNDWVNNGNNHIISLTAMPPGKYQLEVAASTNGKIWYETKQPLTFTINPPFWKTWWFIALTGLVAGIILFVLQKRREDILRKKEKEKLQKQKLVAENLQYKLEVNQARIAVLENERKAITARLQSMRLQMNPHFLFNALNSIQQMIMTGNESNATLYLSKFSKLLRLVLTHSDRETVSLREEAEMLKLYIELEALRFEDTFTYSVEIEKDIDANDNKVPTLLIQPFVENAIWHGLLHKEGDRELHVRFSCNENEDLVCTIEDNGIGREAARSFSKKTSSHSHHTGKGVTVADERLKILNQQNGDSSKLEILDVMSATGEVKGTKVIITLPNLA